MIASAVFVKTNIRFIELFTWFVFKYLNSGSNWSCHVCFCVFLLRNKRINSRWTFSDFFVVALICFILVSFSPFGFSEVEKKKKNWKSSLHCTLHPWNPPQSETSELAGGDWAGAPRGTLAALSGCQMLCQVAATPPRQQQQVAVSVCQQTAGSGGMLT